MNAYYQQKGRINSNNDIFEAYFMEGNVRISFWKRLADQLLAILSILLTFAVSAPVRRFLRVSGTALSLIGMVGTIGAVECGAIGLGMGVLIGLALVGIELLCLRR